MNRRCILQILSAFASYLDVPEAHLKDHNTLPAFENSAPENRQNRMRIPSGKEKPANAFAVAIRWDSRQHWFVRGLIAEQWLDVGGGSGHCRLPIIESTWDFAISSPGPIVRLPPTLVGCSMRRGEAHTASTASLT